MQSEVSTTTSGTIEEWSNLHGDKRLAEEESRASVSLK